jgi:hypothetical protein
VPVIKLECILYPENISDENPSKVPRYFKIPDKANLKFPKIMSKPIKIDITQMTDFHNGLDCVDLVKQYLNENQLIEPLILVLK